MIYIRKTELFHGIVNIALEHSYVITFEEKATNHFFFFSIFLSLLHSLSVFYYKDNNQMLFNEYVNRRCRRHQLHQQYDYQINTRKKQMHYSTCITKFEWKTIVCELISLHWFQFLLKQRLSSISTVEFHEVIVVFPNQMKFVSISKKKLFFFGKKDTYIWSRWYRTLRLWFMPISSMSDIDVISGTPFSGVDPNRPAKKRRKNS